MEALGLEKSMLMPLWTKLFFVMFFAHLKNMRFQNMQLVLLCDKMRKKGQFNY